jgi:uncharacterized membrane protein YtjA (UPF0391 family)
MLYWALLFFVVAIVAGIFSLVGIAGTLAWVAEVLFVSGLIVGLVFLVMRHRPPL